MSTSRKILGTILIVMMLVSQQLGLPVWIAACLGALVLVLLFLPRQHQ
ncbi:MAG: hypothetical protein Q4D85_04270 [Corynebacterium sp.]|nr:hypothetical protein [Corynebacterium sp.]MDO5097952.1 hypothetical protein [Corynebacterium sp.]